MPDPNKIGNSLTSTKLSRVKTVRQDFYENPILKEKIIRKKLIQNIYNQAQKPAWAIWLSLFYDYVLSYIIKLILNRKMNNMYKHSPLPGLVRNHVIKRSNKKPRGTYQP